MSKPKQTPLELEWAKKLKDSGFRDIEATEGIFWSERKKKHQVLFVTHPLTYEYYRLAGFFLHDYNFKDERDKLTWLHHSDGKTLKVISVLLNQAGHKTPQSTVAYIINRLAKKMIEMYDGDFR